MKECDKRNSHISSKLHVVYVQTVAFLCPLCCVYGAVSSCMEQHALKMKTVFELNP